MSKPFFYHECLYPPSSLLHHTGRRGRWGGDSSTLPKTEMWMTHTITANTFCACTRDGRKDLEKISQLVAELANRPNNKVTQLVINMVCRFTQCCVFPSSTSKLSLIKNILEDINTLGMDASLQCFSILAASLIFNFSSGSILY